MVYTFKIVLYYFIAWMIVLLSGKLRVRFLFGERHSLKYDKPLPKYSGIAMFISATAMGLYSTIVSQIPYSSDRRNYVTRFINHWDSPWTPGLNGIADFLHLFTNSPEALFFTVTFLTTILFLVAYRISKNTDKNALILLVSSYCLIYSFFLLKQGPAIALGAIAIVYFLKKKYVLSFVFSFLAIQFHESAFVLFPILLLIEFSSRNKWLRYLSYAVMLMFLFSFSNLSRFSFSLIGRFIPDLMQQSVGYLDENLAIAGRWGNGILTIAKGFPFYLITAYSLLKRKQLKDKTGNYDEFVTISVFTSVASILSGYMYWMSRFGTYCYFPLYLFASELRKVDDNIRDAKWFWSLLVLSTFLLTLRYLIQIFFLYGGF